jgi:hypothetical protein
MKKALIFLGAISLASLLITGCSSSSQSVGNTDTTTVATSNTTQIDENKTVTAKFISGGALEGEADLTFEKEDGSKIVFYRNYMNPDEPELKFQFIGEDGLSANKSLVGQFFVIKYKENPKGRISVETGEGVACNQILSVEKK